MISSVKSTGKRGQSSFNDCFLKYRGTYLIGMKAYLLWEAYETLCFFLFFKFSGLEIKLCDI